MSYYPNTLETTPAYKIVDPPIISEAFNSSISSSSDQNLWESLNHSATFENSSNNLSNIPISCQNYYDQPKNNTTSNFYNKKNPVVPEGENYSSNSSLTTEVYLNDYSNQSYKKIPPTNLYTHQTLSPEVETQIYLTQSPPQNIYQNNLHLLTSPLNYQKTYLHHRFQSPSPTQPLKKPSNQNKNFQLKQGLVKLKATSINPQEKTRNFFKKEKFCYFCEYPEEMVIKSCMHYICTVCICNMFEEYLIKSTNSKEMFGCKVCSRPYICKIFKEFVLEESFRQYLAKQHVLISRDPLINKQNLMELNPVCTFCGENHIRNKISCLEHFKDSQFKICFKCKSRVKEEEIHCGCMYCRRCLKNILNEQLQENPYCNSFKCRCGAILYGEVIRSIFGGKEELDRKREKYLEKNEKFNCCVCYALKSIQKITILDCCHYFCSKCLKSYFLSCIESNNISAIYFCPGCLRPDSKPLKMDFNEKIIEKVLDKYQFNLYYKLMLKSISKDSSEEKLFLKWCKNCDYGAFIEPIYKFKVFGLNLYSKPQIFKCPKCGSSYCSYCNQKHSGSSCPITKPNNSLSEIKLEGNFIECPKCQEIIEKVSGCNFIHCLWPGCQDSYFCWICKKSLKVILIQDTQHYSHYKKSGPFGSTCNTIDKIPDY